MKKFWTFFELLLAEHWSNHLQRSMDKRMEHRNQMSNTLCPVYMGKVYKNEVLMCHCPYINFNSSSVTDMSIFREVGQKVIQKILRHNSIPISSWALQTLPKLPLPRTLINTKSASPCLSIRLRPDRSCDGLRPRPKHMSSDVNVFWSLSSGYSSFPSSRSKWSEKIHFRVTIKLYSPNLFRNIRFNVNKIKIQQKKLYVVLDLYRS